MHLSFLSASTLMVALLSVKFQMILGNFFSMEAAGFARNLPDPNPFSFTNQTAGSNPRVVAGQDFVYLPDLVITNYDEGCHGVLFSHDIVVTSKQILQLFG